MRYKFLLTICLIIGLLSGTVAIGQWSWDVMMLNENNDIQPIDNSFGLAVPHLVGGAGVCASIDSGGIFATTTCGGGGDDDAVWSTSTNRIFPKTITDDLGIGTSTPMYSIEINGTSTNGFFGVSQNNSGDLFAINNNGYVGIGTTNPTYELDVAGNINAFAVYTRPDYKTAKDTYKPCPAGYILVPGSEKYGTADFCVMKYEARECNFVDATTTDCSGQTKAAGSGDPADEQWAASYPENKPWITIQQDADSAQEACEQIGTGFHLITNAEWMTIADNIIHTQINDLDKDTALYQLATGHTDNSPAASVTSTASADPTVSGCNLNLSLEETANAYASTSCELRGTGGGDHSDNAHGYYGTEQNWSTTYTSGGSNASQLRTHVLSNGEVIWDLAGNVWKWTDDTMTNTHAIESSSGATGWEGYFAADSDGGYLTNAQGFNIIPNISTSYTANNHGIGRIYIDIDDAVPSGTTHAFLRGGYWNETSHGGVFALALNSAPAFTYTTVGFRCAQTVLPVRDHLAVTGTQLSTIKNDLYIGGNLGIADYTPDFKLETVGSSGSGYLGVTNSSDGDIFIIDTSGNIGIGTTTPNAKLTVVGNISGTGALTVDGLSTLASLTVLGTTTLDTDLTGFLKATSGVVSTSSIDISTDTNLTCGDHCTLTADEIDIDTEVITHTKCFAIEHATSTDKAFAHMLFPTASTLTYVSCSVSAGATSTIQADERAEATPNTSGTDAFTSPIACDPNSATTTSFNNATMAARSILSFDIDSSAGTPTSTRMCVEFTIND